MSDTDINGGDKTSADLTLKIAGQEVNLRNVKSLNTILTTFTFFVCAFLTFLVWTHMAEAKDETKSVSQALKESNAEVAKALREATRENVELFKSMAQEQRRMTQAIIEGNCLADPMMRQRPDARDFCKRMAGDRR